MGRIAGIPNKVTADIKKNLQSIIDGVLFSIDINKLDANQKIKLLQISLQYAIPRLKYTSEHQSEYPTDIQINILKSNGELKSNIEALSEKKHND